MSTLHIANKNYSSWSLRPWVLLKTLDIPFDEKLHPFPENGVWEAYRKFTPSGRVPCLHVQDTVVWDSLAIVEYLAEEHAAIWPKEKSARAWARSATAEMHSGFTALRNQCGMNCGLRIQLHEVSASLQRDLSRIDELWTEGLQKFGGPYLAGSQFTAVDAFFAPVIFRVQTYQLSLSPVATLYWKAMLQLPAMKTWYDEALREPWRDSAHEKEVLASGILQQDLRQ